MQFITQNISEKIRRRAIHYAFQTLHKKWVPIFGANLEHIGGSICTDWRNGLCHVTWPLRPKIETIRLINRLLAQARHIKAHELTISALPPICPRDLPDRLSERGFEYAPETSQVMFLDCRNMNHPIHAPKGITIEILDIPPPVEDNDLPYHDEEQIRFFSPATSSTCRSSNPNKNWF